MEAAEEKTNFFTNPGYRHYVLLVLFIGYVVNVMDRAVLGILLEPIKLEFDLTDTQLGLLGGMAFAFFYAVMGIPIAAWADRSSRTKVLSLAIALWSGMTALCGMAGSFGTLLMARVGTAVGEAGGSPPSHSIISDYFPLNIRGTALSLYALGVPIGTMVGSLAAGWGNDLVGWRTTFILIGLPGIAVALLVRFTIKEPQRGMADKISSTAVQATKALPIPVVLKTLWGNVSFRHLCFAAGLHSFVWYGGSIWNATFLIRSHSMSSSEAGSWLALFAAIGAIGTFLGGYLGDRLSSKTGDKRWYMWVAGYATILMLPFQFFAYMSSDMWVMVPCFAIMVVLATMFFGPSFAMTQALATLRSRAIAVSILLFMQTLIGLGLGPLCVGFISDYLKETAGEDSLGYGLVIVGLVNIWAAVHYFLGARTLHADLAKTKALSEA